MALFDTLIGDIAERFGLGANAAPLVREVLNLVVGTPHGLTGFLDKLQAAGLGAQVASWLGSTNPAPLAEGQLERVLGPSVFSGIANRLGLGSSVVSAAIGYVLPKVIGALTPGGAIPASLPSEVTKFLIPAGLSAAASRPESTIAEYPAPKREAAAPDRQRPPAQVPPRRAEIIREEPKKPAAWLWPAIAVAGALALGAMIYSQQETPAPEAPVVSDASEAPPAPVTPAPKLPPQFALSDVGGVIHYSGSVQDEKSRATITDALQSVFGPDTIQGSIDIDANREAAPWLASLAAAFENFKLPGLKAAFNGNSLDLSGLGEADRMRIVDALKGLFGGDMSINAVADTSTDQGNHETPAVAPEAAEPEATAPPAAASATPEEAMRAATARAAEIAAAANARASEALASLKKGFGAKDLAGILNLSIVNFPTAGFEVPATEKGLLLTAAARIKQLSPKTVLEIAGYTDNTGDESANLILSQRRAEAVRKALIAAGVRPSALVAKGFGSSNPVGDNESEEGRFHNRRIEYRVIKS